MELSETLDLPRVPDCFSKLLFGENAESSAVPNQPWREAERLRELKDVMLKSLAEESVPDSKRVLNGNCEHCEESGVGQQKKTKNDSGVSLSSVSSTAEDDAGEEPLFCRLNAALCKLKQEMIDLRHMDMSLFCQLLSLNEAILDYKMSVSDRYSEYTGSEYTGSEFTGSEYSFGGMGSRTGSLSSLIEESEWSRGSAGTHSDDLLSPMSGGDACDQLSPGAAEDLAASTSSLLQQISALTQRAEADF